MFLIKTHVLCRHRAPVEARGEEGWAAGGYLATFWRPDWSIKRRLMKPATVRRHGTNMCWPSCTQQKVPVCVLIPVLEFQPLALQRAALDPALATWTNPPGLNLSRSEGGGWSLVESPSPLTQGSSQPQEPRLGLQICGPTLWISLGQLWQPPQAHSQYKAEVKRSRGEVLKFPQTGCMNTSGSRADHSAALRRAQVDGQVQIFSSTEGANMLIVEDRKDQRAAEMQWFSWCHVIVYNSIVLIRLLMSQVSQTHRYIFVVYSFHCSFFHTSFQFCFTK